MGAVGGGARRRTRRALAPWPGTVPGPAPARVFDPPLPADLRRRRRRPGHRLGTRRAVGPTRRAVVRGASRRGRSARGVGGPWPHDLRWWDHRRRRALWQVVVDAGDGAGVACLVVLERGRAAVEAIYD